MNKNYGKYRPDILWFRFLGYMRRRYYMKRALRPASWPFLSGDTYRSFAQHTWDEVGGPNFTVDQIRENDIVFVSAQLKKFLVEYAPRIAVPFYLISSNDDGSVSEKEIDQIRGTKCLHWWAANLIVESDVVTSIPLGLENERLCWFGDLRDIKRVQKLSGKTPKEEKIVWGFTVGNNPAERGPIKAALEANPLAVELPRMNPYSYRREIIKYKYLASPPGHGPDCHRTWEALALGMTPVLLKSTMAMQFKRQGYPIIILDSPEDFATFPAPNFRARDER